MAKINATYSSGYYLGHDVDLRRLEESRQKDDRKRDRDEFVVRQTFAIPFDVMCKHCNRRVARGSHVYTNRRPTEERYLKQMIWELEIRCKYCQQLFFLRTDPITPKETGGYVCARFCERGEGDFLELNRMNAAEKAKAEAEQAQAELDPLEALERENERARQLAQRNREVEELVEMRDMMNDAEMLDAVRSRRRHAAESLPTRNPPDEDADLEADDAAYRQFEARMLQLQQPSPSSAKMDEKNHNELNDVAVAMRLYASARGSHLPKVEATVAPTNSAPASSVNVFMLEDDDDDDDAVNHGSTRSQAQPPPTKPAHSTLLSSMFDDDDDDD